MIGEVETRPRGRHTQVGNGSHRKMRGLDREWKWEERLAGDGREGPSNGSKMGCSFEPELLYPTVVPSAF